jgi:TonB-linked SusC/RagA family outer membrane protein
MIKRYLRISILATLLISMHTFLLAQEVTITGSVTSAEDNAPLPGASIYIKGTTRGTVTDLEGNYTILVQPGSDILVFTFIGHVDQEIPVGAQTEIIVVLEPERIGLDEIVVIGYGTVKKSDLTGSVSSVRGDDLIKIPASSPEQALQGKVSGVRVTSNSGAPGSAPTVRIRGVGTFGNPDPIFVVDGVILDDITFLNSADIESMEVLKDASSTAMYGSRGANGVIIITTKSGRREGKPVVNVSAGYDVQVIQNFIDMLEAREFAQTVNKINPGTFNNLDVLENTDWQKEVYQQFAPIQNYQLSVSGGSESTRYYAGVGYYNQQGVIPKSNYERLSIKVNNEYLPAKFIRFGHNLTFSLFDQQYAPNVVASTLRAWPTDPAYNDDGTFYGNRGNGNPLASIEYTNNGRDGIRSVGNFYGDVLFLKYFTFRTSFGVDLEYSDGKSFSPVYFVTPQQQNEETSLSKDRFSRENWLWENTLNFNFDQGDHYLDAVIGYTTQQFASEGFSGQGRNLIRDDIQYLSNDLTDILIGNGASLKTMVSYLFRANYVYKGRYLLTATFRRDGSSVFSKENRWGNFPSFAAGWRISEEEFFDIDAISNLKIRGSWGIVGNDKVDTNERFTLIQNELGTVFGINETLYPGSTYGTSGNPLIRWEEAVQSNLGIELGFLNNKLILEMDYYRKVTKDILIDLPLPAHFGNGSFTYVKFNAADVLNRGFEFNASWRETRGDFRYEISAVGSTVHNEVLKMGEQTGADNFLLLGSLGNGQSVKRVAVGQSIGYFYGYQVDGVFQNESELETFPRLSTQGVGDFRYKDVNGDGSITSDDRTSIGSPIPDFMFGLGFNASYKGFSVSLDLQGDIGQEIYDGKDAVRAGQYNYQARILDAWDGEGTSNTEPQVTAGGINYSQSDWFIYSGSFFRIRSFTLGYDLPEGFLKKLYIQRANLFIRGTNVLTLTKYTGYTPEIGGSISMNGIDGGEYPVTSVYGVGINLTF